MQNKRRKFYMEEKKWKVYVHVFPNGKMYFGITSKSVSARWQKGNGYANRNLPMCRAIEKYGWENIQHIVLYEGLTQEEACQKEIELIAKYKTNISRYGDEFGYNLTDGGEGTTGHKISEELKEQFRQASLKRRGKDSPNSKPVICDGIEYDSLTDFMEKNGNPKGNINGWLNGKVGMPEEWYNKGLCYKKLGTEITFPSKIHNQRIRKAAVGDIVFDTLADCGEYLGVTASAISVYLTNKQTPPDFIIEKNLRYEDEPFHVFKERKDNRGMKCKCYYDGIIFDSQSELARFLGVGKCSLNNWLLGKNKMPKEYLEKGLKRIE